MNAFLVWLKLLLADFKQNIGDLFDAIAFWKKPDDEPEVEDADRPPGFISRLWNAFVSICSSVLSPIRRKLVGDGDGPLIDPERPSLLRRMLDYVRALYEDLVGSLFGGRNENEPQPVDPSTTWARRLASSVRTTYDDTLGRLFRKQENVAQLSPSPSRYRSYAIVSSLVVAIFAVAFYWLVPRDPRMSESTKTRLLNAIQMGDQQTAMTLGKPLLSKDCPDDPELRFEFAKFLNSTKRNKQYDELLSLLAPVGVPGLPAAHIKRAEKCALQLGSVADPQLLQELKWHLTQSGSAEPELIEWYWFLYYRSTGQLERALDHLHAAATYNKDLLLLLAQLQRQTGAVDLSNNTFSESLKHFQSVLDSGDKSTDAVLRYASAASQMNQIDKAMAAVKRAMQDSDDPRLKSAVADLYVQQFDQSTMANPPAIRVEHLMAALRFDPENQNAISRMPSAFRGNANVQEQQLLRETLQAIIEAGHGTTHAHFALGTILLLASDNAAAKTHFEKSLELDKFSAQSCNNLAWLLADMNIELDRALELAKQAVDAQPYNLAFRDTYAIVLMRHGDLEQAISEFQQVLSGPGDHRSVHAHLADIYELLGNDRIAALHRQKSK